MRANLKWLFGMRIYNEARIRTLNGLAVECGGDLVDNFGYIIVLSASLN